MSKTSKKLKNPAFDLDLTNPCTKKGQSIPLPTWEVLPSDEYAEYDWHSFFYFSESAIFFPDENTTPEGQFFSTPSISGSRLASYYLIQDIRITEVACDLNGEDFIWGIKNPLRLIYVKLPFDCFVAIEFPSLDKHRLAKRGRSIGYIYWQIARVVGDIYQKSSEEVKIDPKYTFTSLEFRQAVIDNAGNMTVEITSSND